MLKHTQTIAYTCDRCGAQNVALHEVASGSQAARPNLPDGWLEIGNSHYCDKHQRTIVIDGDRADL